MSQSDYIKYKRISTVLKSSRDLPPVLTEQNYVDYKQYAIENSIPDTKLIENTLIPSGSFLIFDVLKKTTNCPTFPVCKRTNTRVNRVPMSKVYFTPKPVAKYVKTPYVPMNMNNCYTNKRFSNSVYIRPNVALCSAEPIPEPM